MRYIILLSLLALLASCNTGEKKPPEKEKSPESIESREMEYLQKGGEIVGLAQAELLKNVAAAMGEGGPGHAVDFCNVHALSIKDSLSLAHSCEIRRIALKYRNPEDKAATETEEKVLLQYEKAALSGASLQPEVHFSDNGIEYYHPIFMGTAACLLCHGTPGEQISPETMEMIRAHYPDDLATGFQMDDFRGAWKISFLKKD